MSQPHTSQSTPAGQVHIDMSQFFQVFFDETGEHLVAVAGGSENLATQRRKAPPGRDRP